MKGAQPKTLLYPPSVAPRPYSYQFWITYIMQNGVPTINDQKVDDMKTLERGYLMSGYVTQPNFTSL